MDGSNEVLQVLKEIRDEARATNARLDQTNARLGSLEKRVGETNERLDETNARLKSLESRIEFLEHRVTAGFEKLDEEISALADALGQRITDSEMRLATAVTELAAVTHEVHAVLVRAKLAERVSALEDYVRGK